MSQKRNTDTLYEATKKLLIKLDTVDNALEQAKILSASIIEIVGNDPDKIIESPCWYETIILAIIAYYNYDENQKILILLSQKRATFCVRRAKLTMLWMGIL